MGCFHPPAGGDEVLQSDKPLIDLFMESFISETQQMNWIVLIFHSCETCSDLVDFDRNSPVKNIVNHFAALIRWQTVPENH